MATLRPWSLNFARELFDDRRFAGAADGEIADGDDLHAEGGIAQNADVVEKAADLDGDLKSFGQSEKEARAQCRAFAATFLEDDFENERFGVLDEIPELFLHRRSLPN